MDGRSVREYAAFSRLLALKHALAFGTASLVFVVVLTGLSSTPFEISIPLHLRVLGTLCLAFAVIAGYRLVTAYWLVRLDRRIRARYDPIEIEGGSPFDRRLPSLVDSHLPSSVGARLPAVSVPRSERVWNGIAFAVMFFVFPLIEILVVVRWSPPPPIELDHGTVMLIQMAMSVVLFAIGWATATAFAHLAERADHSIE